MPIPNIDRRQYLTGVKLQGEFVVFLVRTSGSMLDDTIDAPLPGSKIRTRRNAKRRNGSGSIQSLEWMLASLDPETHFQVLFFNEETTPIIPTRGEEWFDTKDRKTMTEVMKRLNEYVPKGGANSNTRLPQFVSFPGCPTASC